MAAYMRSMESSMLTGENSAGEAGKIPGEKNDVNKKDGADSTSPPPPPVKLPKRPPKIYYGSRTHRQISQVTKELRRTIYRETKMTILSSRDFTCIQQGNRNKTELCNEFMDPLKKARCPYYNENNKQEISHYDALNHMGFPMPFDIEDMVNLGNERGCCPYFAARNLMVEADLILCPYNYLIDPSIRKVMQINLQDAIIILDEAHNIEDICRASASTSFTIEELDAVIDDCSEFHKHCTSVYDKEPDFVEVCYYFCSKLKNLIETRPDLKKRDSKSNSAVYSPIWNVAEAGEHQNKVRDDLAAGAPIGVTLSMATMRILEKYQYPFQMFRCSEKRDDFRVFVKEATEWLPSSKSGVHPETVRTLECLCMNPGVVFSPLAESARSIILASGTLSPIISFASELGTTFKQILQNKHVIPKENVHIRVIPKGPQGIAIKATYDNTSQWKVQDEIGRVIVDACESVPFGVLCFLPSYALLNTIFTRMTENGTMSRIRKIKVVFTEPKRNAELDEVMRDYRGIIKQLTDNPGMDGVTGALLFAVFRGKVAEGIDFSDNEARAVITIGIPYAVHTDPAVNLKIKYNDQNKPKQLMSGGEWYKVQAYRALNQALGRCIRHISDWGAILLVDERLMDSNGQKYLPKWMKTIWGMGPEHDTNTMKFQLSTFVKERTKAAELKKTEGSQLLQILE